MSEYSVGVTRSCPVFSSDYERDATYYVSLFRKRNERASCLFKDELKTTRLKVNNDYEAYEIAYIWNNFMDEAND